MNPSVNAPNIADTTICSGGSVLLDAGSGYAGYNWTDGQLSSTNQSITVSPGVQTVYVLTVNNSFGCTDTDSVTVSVEQSPNAAFSTASGGLNVVNFTNNSTPSTGVTYSWNFGDGSPADNTANPTHTYGANGAYNVTLVVTNNCGSDSTSTTVFIDGISVTEIYTDEIVVYPNPTNGNITVVNPFENAALTLYSSTGQILHSTTLTQKNTSINYGTMPTGVYVLALSTSKGIKYTRLVITK